ncbi:cytochrome d ubiquinol oxidase subunit II [Actinomadura scrupuli]|uniref:cytochrome d ubiquinol oxidase subunit II n=1 Tax=Actinomadura scrupuli TaxID=559629 RepID=UPI003D99F9E8
MDLLAVTLLAFFAGGYLVLAGADIGVGMLLPVLGRDQRRRRLVIAGIAPFFLGNEVWLVAVLGLMAGAFPGLEELVLGGLRAPVLALVTGWMVRDAGLWLRGRADARTWRAACDTAIVAGSWALALSWGAILGDIAVGLPGLNAGLLFALPAAALFAVHGAGFAALRLTGEPYERARRLPGRFAVTAPLLAVLPVAAGARLPWSQVEAGGTALALTATTTVAVLPLLLAAQSLTWWTFRHRVDRPSYL